MPPGRPRKNKDVLVKSAELIGWAIGGIEREISQTRERLAALTAQATKLRKRAGVRSTSAIGVVGSDAPDTAATGKKRWAERRKGK